MTLHSQLPPSWAKQKLLALHLAFKKARSRHLHYLQHYNSFFPPISPIPINQESSTFQVKLDIIKEHATDYGFVIQRDCRAREDMDTIPSIIIKQQCRVNKQRLESDFTYISFSALQPRPTSFISPAPTVAVFAVLHSASNVIFYLILSFPIPPTSHITFISFFVHTKQKPVSTCKILFLSKTTEKLTLPFPRIEFLTHSYSSSEDKNPKHPTRIWTISRSTLSVAAGYGSPEAAAASCVSGGQVPDSSEA